MSEDIHVPVTAEERRTYFANSSSSVYASMERILVTLYADDNRGLSATKHMTLAQAKGLRDQLTKGIAAFKWTPPLDEEALAREKAAEMRERAHEDRVRGIE